MEQLEQRIAQLELKLTVALDVMSEKLAKAQGAPKIEKEFILQEIEEKLHSLSKHKP